MRRVKTTLFSIISIAVIIYIVTQAQSIGAPWIFTAAGIFMIIVIVISVIRAWLRP
jgi:hypothetical protein